MGKLYKVQFRDRIGFREKNTEKGEIIEKVTEEELEKISGFVQVLSSANQEGGKK